MRPKDDLPPSLQSLFAEAPEVHVLDNGLTVLFQPMPAHPVVSVQAWVRTGSIHEAPYLGSGLSHFLEHMLFKGTGKRGPGDIAREAQEFGGDVNAYTAFDRTVYYIDGPAEALGRMLELLADQTLNASLPREEIGKEREVILREIDMALDDPDRILSRALFSTAYREHPFRYPVIGLRPLFEKVDRDMLHGYYTARYQPDNMVVAVAGHFDREALMKELASTFGKAPRACLRPVPVPAEAGQLARREARLFGDYQTVRGFLAFKIPSLRHADAPALDILAAVIGSGQSGRLRQKIREEQQLVHGISASTWNPGDPGLFIIQYQCAAETAARAEEAILEACRGFAESGFDEEEVAKACRFAMVSEVQSRLTTSGVASRLGLVGALVGDLHYPEQYFRRISALDASSLRELARQTFREDQLTVATLMPEKMRPRARAGAMAGGLPPIEDKVLANGARLLWQRDPRLPRTWLRFGGLGGALYEDPARRGATSLLSTLLTRDTEHHSAFHVARRLESRGGFMAEAAGNNTFAVAVEVMPEGLDLGIETLRDAVLHPAFKQETLERERAAQVAQIREMQDEILDCGRLALRRHFFGDHPFAISPLGTLETAPLLDQASMRALYRRIVTGGNAVVSIAGDFDPQVVLPQLEELLLQLPATPFAKVSVPFPAPARTGEVRETMEREQAIVFEAYPDVGLRPELELVAEVLDELLSDMSGPLFRSVREDQSLAYFVGASRLVGIDYGCFYLYAGTHPSTTQAVYNCFDLELKRLRDGGVSAEELKPVVTRLKVQNRSALQSPGTRAARASLNALYGKPVMDWLDYEARLDALTPSHLAAFANTFLAPSQCLRLTIAPK